MNTTAEVQPPPDRPGRFRFGLLEAFLLFVLLLFLSETALQYFVSISAAARTSEAILEQTAEALENRFSQLIESTEFFLVQAAGAARRRTIDFSDYRSANPYLMEYMRAHPFVTSVNYGDSDGNGYLILRTDGGWRNRLKKAAEKGTVTWLEVDDRGNVLARERRRDDYDPRDRPWYRNAAGSDAVRWTRPYVFRTTRDMGITASLAVAHGKRGPGAVIGADVMLKDLSMYFRALAMEHAGLSIALVSGEGEIVALSDTAAFSRHIRPGADTAPVLSAGGFEVLGAALRASRKEGTPFVSFDWSGRSFFALQRPLRLSGNPALQMILTVPQESHVSMFRSVYRLRAVAYLVVVALMAFFFARRYLAPLRKLTDAVRKTGNGGFRSPVDPERSDEVGVLASELARMADALSARERELTAMLDNVPGVVYRGHPDWSLSLIGAEVEKITGIAAAEFTSGAKCWRDIIHPEDIGRIEDTFRRAVRARERVLRVEYRILHRDGVVRWIEDRRQLIYDDGGIFLSVEGLLIDVTDNKIVESKLREREDLYRDLVEHGHALICAHDLEGRILSVNALPAEILGIPQGELAGMNLRDLIAPEFLSAFDAYLQEIRCNGRATGLMTVVTRSGERRIWEYDNTLRTEGVPQPVVRGIARDVTEQKRMEKALRDANERLRLATIAAGLGVWEWDVRNDRLHWDETMFRIFGLPDGTVPGGVEWWKRRVHPDDRAAVTEAARKVPETRGVFETEFRIVRPDGEVRSVHTLATTVRDARGEVTRLIGIDQDVTGRKRADAEKAALEAQLRQAMKMEAVGQLAGGVAHDFNNILTAVLGNVSLALMKVSRSDPAARLLAEACRAAERGAALVRRLLVFSRREIVEPKILDVNKVIADLGGMLSRLIGEHIELKTVCGEGLGSVRVDPAQLEQVLVNLVVNARDAMPDGGTLLIETSNSEFGEEYCARHPDVRAGRYVTISVRDTGHGMSDEVRARIFEPFFTTKPKGTGTGLGLATVYGVVKQADGHIEVDSSLGKGTTFRIHFPIVEGQAPGLPEPERSGEPPRGSETILVVEDDEGVREMGIRVLERLGYRVLAAPNGDEAIAAAQRHSGRIDLLLTDVVMPGMNGRELAERIARIRPDVKVLFTSGYTDDAILRHGVLDEGVSFIGKPYSLRALARKIREVLDGG